MRKAKRFFGCFSIILFFLLLLGGIIAALTVTGYTEKFVCDVVVEDSYLWDEVGCNEDGATSSTIDKSDDVSKLIEELEKGNYEDRVSTIVEVVQPGVVGIGIEGNTLSGGGIVGTGFVISEDGKIATNYHVVSDSRARYFVQAENVEKTLSVVKVYEDPTNDIAILEVKDGDKLQSLNLGSSFDLKVGQEVIAIGNPLGNLSGTVTKGIVSAVGRNVDISSGGFFNSRIERFEGVIQTDAAINPGNSGGPLINMKGQVVGMNFATVGGADNLSFALPIERISKRLAELEEYGKFKMPYLGIEYRDRVVFIDQVTIFAAEIVDIANNSPAEKGGFKEGDFIIGVNGKDLDNSSLSNYVQDMEIGEKVKFNVIRGDKEKEIEVRVGVKILG